MKFGHVKWLQYVMAWSRTGYRRPCSFRICLKYMRPKIFHVDFAHMYVYIHISLYCEINWLNVFSLQCWSRYKSYESCLCLLSLRGGWSIGDSSSSSGSVPEPHWKDTYSPSLDTCKWLYDFVEVWKYGHKNCLGLYLRLLSSFGSTILASYSMAACVCV